MVRPCFVASGWLVVAVAQVDPSASIWDARHHIFDDVGYDAHDPPPNMQLGQPLDIKVGISVQKVEFDILTSTLRLSLWLRLKWLDERLLYDPDVVWGLDSWNESDYLPIRLRTGDDVNLWVPDIHVVEAVDSSGGLAESMAYIHHRRSPGVTIDSPTDSPWNVFLSRPGTYEIVCSPDLKAFPFDTPTCSMTIESWSFNSQYLRLSNMTDGFQNSDTMPVSADYMFEDGSPFAWPTADKKNNSQTVSTWEALGSSWSSYRIQLRLRRLPGYHVVHSVMPLTMVLVLGAFTFFLPMDSESSGSGERLTYTVTLFLTIIAVMLFTAGKRPAIAETTWLDKWQSRSLWLSVIPIIETIFIFWLNNMVGIMRKRETLVATKRFVRTNTGNSFKEKAMGFSEGLASRVVGVFGSIEAMMPECIKNFFGSFGPHNVDNWMQILYPLIVTLTFNRLPYEIVNAYSAAMLRRLRGNSKSMGSTGIFVPVLSVQIAMFCFSVYYVWRRCRYACRGKDPNADSAESSSD